MHELRPIDLAQSMGWPHFVALPEYDATSSYWTDGSSAMKLTLK